MCKSFGRLLLATEICGVGFPETVIVWVEAMLGTKERFEGVVKTGNPWGAKDTLT